MSRKPISIRFDPDLLDEAESYIDKHGMQKAELFEMAVSEFIDADRSARLEQKIDGLIKSMGEDPTHLRKIGQGKENVRSDSKSDAPDSSLGDAKDTQSEESANKDDSPSTEEETPVPEPPSDEELSDGPFPMPDSKTDSMANRMANYLVLEAEETSKPAISHADILEAIQILGGSSDYFKNTYFSLIGDRLDELGWFYNPLRGWWYHDESVFQKQLEHQWEEAVEIASGEVAIDAYDTEDAYMRLHKHEDKKETVETLVDNEVAEKDEITRVLSRIGKRVDRLENGRKKAWGN